MRSFGFQLSVTDALWEMNSYVLTCSHGTNAYAHRLSHIFVARVSSCRYTNLIDGSQLSVLFVSTACGLSAPLSQSKTCVPRCYPVSISVPFHSVRSVPRAPFWLAGCRGGLGGGTFDPSRARRLPNTARPAPPTGQQTFTVGSWRPVPSG